MAAAIAAPLFSRSAPGCPGKDKAFARLLYATSFLHAVVLGRRGFRSTGWSVAYHFNEVDFGTAVHQLRLSLNDGPAIMYDAIQYLFAECIYGARIHDDWDARILRTILVRYLNDAVVTDPFYHFVRLSHYDYGLPRRPERREIRQYISDDIPLTDAASVYGLHEYTNAHFELLKSKQLIDTIARLPARAKAAPVTFNEFDVAIRDRFAVIRGKLAGIVDAGCLFRTEWHDQLTPLDVFLNQEIESFKRLWHEIEQACDAAERVFNGNIV